MIRFGLFLVFYKLVFYRHHLRALGVAGGSAQMQSGSNYYMNKNNVYVISRGFNYPESTIVCTIMNLQRAGICFCVERNVTLCEWTSAVDGDNTSCGC